MSDQTKLTKRELKFRDAAIHLQEQLDLAVMDRNAVIDECAKCVPTNWCDALLTGPDAPKCPLDNQGVERLLRGVQDRIHALKSPPEEVGGQR